MIYRLTGEGRQYLVIEEGTKARHALTPGEVLEVVVAVLLFCCLSTIPATTAGSYYTCETTKAKGS